MRFVLLPSAKDDLNEIRQYLRQESPAATKIVAARIISSLLLFTEQPHLGHKTDDEEVMEWHIPGLPYWLPYMIVNNEIRILRVFHNSQNKPDVWRDH